MFKNLITSAPALTVLSLFMALPAFAGERRFAYTYEATTSPKGAVEFENWVTWKDRGQADTFDFRHELEFGVTDRLQVGLYLFDWQYDTGEDKAQWQKSGVELIYNLTNPTTDVIGSALYLEVLGGEDELKIEGKLLLQKNFGPLRVAYNAILEAEWEGDSFGNFDERNGEFAQTVGISYDLNKKFSIGAEALHEIPLPDWSEAGESAVFLGPNASVRFGRMFVTATALFQVTEIEDEPDTQVRVITGIDF